MNNTIKIYIKSVWGNDNIYIASEEHIEPVRMLTGKVTIDRNDIEALKALGLSFEQVVPNKLEI